MADTSNYSKRTVEIRVGGRYRLGKKIGAGSFGEIYEGSDIFDNSEVAIKLEHNSIKYPQLLFEAKLLKSIPGTGISQMHWFGIAGEYNAMVMELLGQNLEDLFNFCTRNFTLKTILMISIQLIERIKHIHDNHYVHRDIKPENFLIGKGQTEQTIYIIDFGLAKRYRDEHTRIHIPLKENRNLTGTARYASCNAHNGLEQSRRDDMESIGYVLLYLLKGSLPWQGLKCKDKTEKYQKIKELKMSTPPEKLCEGLPIEFAKYIEYVKKLAFEEEPEYKKYIMLFTELFKHKDFEMDYMYDWITVKNNTRVLKEASICRSDEFSKAQNQIDKKNRNDNNIDSTMKDNNDTKAIGDSNYKNQQSMMKAFEKYNDKENLEANDIEGIGKKKGKTGKNEKCYVF
jgi:serine/threonine protein kinase